MFSSAKDEWRTPPDLFARLNREFAFTLDVAADDSNHLCVCYFTEAGVDALTADWHVMPGVVCWCNPPYSRGRQKQFIAKAALERTKGVTTVMLLPARTDTKAFHAHIWDERTNKARTGVEVRFMPGRIKFVGADHGAPFPSMIVVFRP
jgi:phage N-6-adenine-methyltransferase